MLESHLGNLEKENEKPPVSLHAMTVSAQMNWKKTNQYEKDRLYLTTRDRSSTRRFSCARLITAFEHFIILKKVKGMRYPNEKRNTLGNIIPLQSN